MCVAVAEQRLRPHVAAALFIAVGVLHVALGRAWRVESQWINNACGMSLTRDPVRITGAQYRQGAQRQQLEMWCWLDPVVMHLLRLPNVCCAAEKPPLQDDSHSAGCLQCDCLTQRHFVARPGHNCIGSCRPPGAGTSLPWYSTTCWCWAPTWSGP